LSTTNESSAAPAATAAAIADPAPLGLAGFALTTFLLSASNAGLTRGGGGEWLPYALAYGGIAQLLAGMWEFRNGNVFGSTAFGTYGSFWIGLFFFFHFIVPTAGENVTNDLGWILLAFAIFNTYMLIFSTQTNIAVFGVFLTLEVTEILLFIGFFSNSTSTVKAGGYVGILTAVVAWYASASGVIAGMKGKPVLPVGGPLMNIGG
jgi:succinate-acetate transporter protein